MGKRRGFLLLALVSFAALAGACMWDSDTLAEEAKGKMDLVGTIVGRFDRNPPLYYQMRIKRILMGTPLSLGNYDNLAVAEERLGHHDAAIDWMAKKKAHLKPLSDKKNAAFSDAWYRYHANLGTFYAHRALDRTGAYKPDDFEQARQHIRAALHINPNAHFGREVIQLDILNWMGDIETNRFEGSLGEYLREVHEDMPDRDNRIVKGLVGLVRLGNAWQSVDVFAALRDTLSMNEDGNLASLADFRVKELIAGGKRSYLGDSDDGLTRWRPMLEDSKFNEKEYKRLREEAEKVHQQRETFMLAKLKAGKHPDWDFHFWDGYKEGAALEVRSPGVLATPSGRMWGTFSLALSLFCLLPSIVAIFAIRWFRARRRASRGL